MGEQQQQHNNNNSNNNNSNNNKNNNNSNNCDNKYTCKLSGVKPGMLVDGGSWLSLDCNRLLGKADDDTAAIVPTFSSSLHEIWATTSVHQFFSCLLEGHP